jgi:hypothetical protein
MCIVGQGQQKIYYCEISSCFCMELQENVDGSKSSPVARFVLQM